MTQTLVVVMLRTQHIPFFQSSPSRQLGAALTLMCLVSLALPYIPRLSTALHMQYPYPSFYGFLVAIVTSYILLVQGVKMVYMKVYKEWI